ncbi:hypothetical protein EMIHUDRAFT_195699 [Emiliania huxleyi CCMP1516]|uniref:Protein kinase domain-containing protein n=2 Tax=Emiliania huxleyi TaxID=2903 RepID=A0A0D3JHX7_EMIH1|nr:hypothetical protein EMIHUDRAFT_195699 [Emiliania huxleyi CCMP1516]EOD23112.1 hypothetical protein EMIHUDRAFT_195699 [Emiliania huxleyi CCMP1516]|eukprot:XP_005775541.1 hypothetical protein EMIHUDRAFT_195699 [Emiliania huxleyi CCMP1516]
MMALPFLAFWWVCMVVVTALGALCPRLQSAMAIVLSGVAPRPNSDQQRARVLFGRVLLAAVAATLVLIYLRHSALTHAHRLCYIAITALGFGSMPALTEIGRPGEPLLVGGALVLGALMLGEALGYLMEQHARLAFLDRDAAALPPPPCVKDILIDRVVGEGGQGTVYAGRWLGIHVAIKDEARLLARLRHPSVCTLFGATVLSDGGGALVPALTTARRVMLSKRGEPIAVGLAARIAAEVATGISFLHGNGVMHRDIKPSNVLLDTEYHAKVADFGLARLVRAQSSARRGPPTVGYDERCDTFSYGMLLWSLMHEVAVPPSSASASRPRVSLPPDRAVYSGLITRCWQQDPAMRPSMQETVHVGLVNSCSNKLDGEPASEQEGDVGFVDQ